MSHHSWWPGLALLGLACHEPTSEISEAQGSPSRIPDTYTLIDLGTLEGDTYSRPTSLNNRSEVVGYSFPLDAYQTIRGFHWSETEGMTDLGRPPDYDWVLTGQINDNRQIAGSMFDYQTGAARAFLWENGQFSLIEPPEGATYTEAFGLNNNGVVVGWSDLGPGGGPQAFLVEGGERIDLGFLEGGSFSMAFSVNDGGEIVGIGNNGAGAFVGIVWVNGGEQMIDLSTRLSIPDLFPYAISPEGHLAGYSGSLGHAVVVQPGGEAIDLGSLMGPDGYSEAFDVNSAGQVVGSSDSPVEGEYHAFLWDEGEMVDLNDLIDPGEQVVLIDAMGINEQGEIAVFGRVGEEYHTFLLRPAPSP